MNRSLPPILPLAALALALSGCFACSKKETPQTLAPVKLTAERSRDVDFVWYATRDGKPVGGTTAAKVLLKPNPSGDVRVAVYEEYSGGTGSQWRASAWVSSFVAASTLGHDLSEFEFAVSTGGFVDGPSAGGLTTAAFLAAMLDVPVRPGVTLTGTVNPDGSIGPVGGIPDKMRGAKEKGKTHVGYPVGQRYDFDRGSRTLVDLHGLGAELGVEVREVRDIFEAYELLTGRTLTRPTPLPAAAMEISPRYFQRMQAKASAWLARAESQMKLVAQADRTGIAGKLGLLESAQASYDRAVAYQRQGMVPAAYSEAMQAAAYVELTQHFTRQAELALQGDVGGAVLQMKSLSSVEADVAAFRETLATADITTVGEAMGVINAYSAVADARAFVDLARVEENALDRIVTGLGKDQVPMEWSEALRMAGNKKRETLTLLVLGKALTPTLQYVMAKYSVDGARDLFEAREPTGLPIQLGAEAVARLARSYTSAAKANLDYYDSLVLQTEADQAGTTLAAAQARKAKDDVQYLRATAVMGLALRDREKKDLPHALFNLAAAANVYLSSSYLVAREYSIGVRTNEQGKPVVQNDKAFMAMLELAEEKAREQAAVAQKVAGGVPGPAQAAYGLARAMREGDTDSKLLALNHFWGSSTSSQLAVALTRTGGRGR